MPKTRSIEDILSRFEQVPSSEVRKALRDCLKSASEGEMLVVLHYAKPVAALVSAKDAARLALLNSMEFRELRNKLDKGLA